MLVKNNHGRLLLKLVLVLVILAAAGVYLLQGLQVTARVKVAKRDTAVDAVTGTVSVDADGGTKKLDSQAAGIVAWCEMIDPGKKFKEGDVLLRLDKAEMLRARDDAERQYYAGRDRGRFVVTGGKPELLADDLKLTDAQREEIVKRENPTRKLALEKLEYSRRLLALGDVSEEDVRSLERSLEEIDRTLKLGLLDEKKAEADFKVQQKNVEVQLEKMEIRAPSDGQIDGALTWKGALIGNGQTVATFFSNTRVVAAKISEESFGKVKIGQEARVRLLTYGEQYFEATVSKLHPKADDAQRFTAFLDVKVSDPDTLKPGSTGEVTITVDKRPDALMIPRRALFDSDKVFVVKDGRVVRRQVVTGYVALNIVEITKGLEAGEQVIVDRLEDFRDGQRVKVEVIP
ncbi:MAG: efflux RND transporter periplasmic adaptor subunit [Opitutaceae bacterium]|nr:efflux RND transporter periplasmic adaptor subunit [Opitutaceae bacterium]